MKTNKIKLAIYTTATEGYTYALKAQARRIQSCVKAACSDGRKFKLLVLLVGDGCDGLKDADEHYRELLPDAEVELLGGSELVPGEKNYDRGTQLLIGQMRTLATRRAISWGADRLLSLDGDVLPPSNALRCMLDMLEFDRGYYGVAACPYPSQGGGPFLCGRGVPERPILPCFYEDEKDIPEELQKKRDGLRSEIDEVVKAGIEPTQKLLDALKDADKEIESVPPNGNVFELNGRKWRRRGWFDNAYPAIGKGAVVPCEWSGFGCTLMNEEAMALCDWSGYDGAGTEDLYINFHRWYPAGIKIAAIPHAPCDHVVRHRTEKGKYVHIITGHEQSGECIGHLRQWTRGWYPQEPGESYDIDNDGKLYEQT